MRAHGDQVKNEVENVSQVPTMNRTSPRRIRPGIIIRVAAGLLFLAVTLSPAAGADGDGGLYDLDILRTISLTFPTADFWNRLTQASNVQDTYVTADMTVDGVVHPGVGVRFRGNTSQRNAGFKRSMKIAVDHTDPDLRLLGYKTLKLNNGAFDPTFLRDVFYSRIAHEYYPSPTANLVRIEINGEDWGIYTNVQHFNKDLLDEWFESTKGHRWKAPSGGGTGGAVEAPGPGGFASGVRALSFLGADPALYAQYYQLKSDDEGEPWTVLSDFCGAFNNTTLANLDAIAPEILDVDGALWAIALENVFNDEDGYIAKGADYAIFWDAAYQRIHMLQHDGNETFREPTLWDLFESEANANRPIISRLLSIPHLRRRYVAHVRTILDEWLRWDVLGPKAKELHDRIAPFVEADAKKIYSTTAFYANLESTVSIGSGPGGGNVMGLRQYVEERREYLLSFPELQQAPPQIGALTLTSDESTEVGPDGPVAGVPVSVRVSVSAPAQAAAPIEAVILYHSASTNAPFEPILLADDGGHGDGAAGDGDYGGKIPAYPAGTSVRYYIEARSTAATAFEPARAEWGALSYRVAATRAESTPVVINEIMASNTKTIADPQGEFEDWVELRNVSGAAVDLGGMYLTDNEENPRKWEIPSGISLAAGGYLVVWLDENGEDEGEGNPDPVNLHANFKLAKEGERLLLIDRDERNNQILDEAAFSELPADRSWARLPDGGGEFVLLDPTPLAANGTGPAAPRFVRGDVGADGRVDLTDAIGSLGYLFLGEAELACLDSADVDDDGQILLTDPVVLLGWLFLGGASPAPPSPSTGAYPRSDCGADAAAAAGTLGCARFAPCE